MKYDIAIIGGGTAGCAAAYTAAKCGLKTILIEKNSFLGGSISAALVTPAMKTSDNQINTDFYKIFLDELKSLDGQFTYSDGNQGWINPELTKIALDRLLSSVGVNILFSSQVQSININNDKIVSMRISSSDILPRIVLSESIESLSDNYNPYQDLSVDIESTYYIDATGNQVICNGLNCTQINDNGHSQPCSLRFIVGGVDLNKFAQYILEFDKDRNATTACYSNGQVHFSTACTWDKNWALTPIFEEAIQENVLKGTDRAYFQLFTIPGAANSVAFNCPRCASIFEYNDIKSKSKALIEAREAILRLVDFVKKYFPGFENAYISQIAPELGVRVSKRAGGKYLYTIEDLRSGKQFLNPVLISNYPVDVHAKEKENARLEQVIQEYQLPIESLISIDYDNLYFAGRGISADFFAQAALRIIPSCFSMGEGLAKYLAGLEV